MSNNIKIYGIKKQGKLFFPLHEIDNENQFEKSLKDGDAVVRETKKYYEPKTHKQCKTVFGLMIANCIAQVNDMGLDTSGFLKLMLRDDLPSGVPVTKDLLYNLLISLCPIYDNKENKTLSKMNTKQAADFFKNCCILLASRGIYISEPNPNWREKK